MILDEARLDELAELSQKLGYSFKNIGLLNKALTHRSYAHESHDPNVKDNERMEYLGDSVLNLVVSSYLFFKNQDFREGDLSKIRSQVVNEQSLATFARTLDLGKYLLLGKGEQQTGGREKSSLLADAFEAVIAAVHIDSSIESICQILLVIMSDSIELAIEGGSTFDHKGRLQQLLAATGAPNLQYRLIDETGPDHCKTFTVQIWVDGEPYGIGVGKTKKEAERSAADLTYTMVTSRRND